MGLQPVHTLGDQLAHIHFHACGQINKHALSSIDHGGAIRALPVHPFTLETNEEVAGEISYPIDALFSNIQRLQVG